jgi:hypothetical protein
VRRAWGATRVSEPSRSQSLARDPLKQKLEFGTIDPVALHDETDQGIVYQLSERKLGDVYDISLRLFREPANREVRKQATLRSDRSTSSNVTAR